MAIKESVNCIKIELAIMEMFDFRQNLIVPNVSNMMRLVAFETDMLVLTKSGYAHGFEIKVSKSDLKADFSKDHHTQFNVMKNGKTGLERFYSKFKYFSYAVPSELKECALELIHDFCGLYVYDKPELPKQPKFYCARKPKKLFDYKWSDEKRYELARLGAMRIHSLKKASLWRMTRIKQLKNNLTKESNGKANS